MASNDVGDEETKTKRGDEGSKGSGCDKGNNENDNI